MKKQQSFLIQIFIVVSLLALLAFVFTQSRSLNTERHDQTLKHLSAIIQLDDELNSLLLRVRYRLLKNYDPINQTFTLLEQHLLALQQAPLAITQLGNGQLLASLEKEQQRLEQKEQAWQAFASHNAVLKNSLYYADMLIVQAKIRQDANSIDQWQLFDQLERQLITLNLLGLGQLQDNQRIEHILAQLNTQHVANIDTLTTHIHLVQTHEIEVDHLLKDMTDNKHILGVSLLEAYRAFVDQQSHRADIYRWWLFILASILLLYAVYSLRQERNMVHRLKNQQFALDEHAIVSITDVAGVITYANARFCQVSGYTQQELIGHTHSLVNSGYHPPAFFTDLWQTISAGKVWHGQVKNRTKHNDTYWVNATVVPFFNHHGKIEQFISIRTDITQQKQLEESLIIAKKAAEAASQAKSDFLATMSHEIRTPMNGILGMTEIVLDTNLDDEQREYIHIVKDSADALMVVINDILDFSKIEAGKLELENLPFNLRKSATDCMRTLEARAIQKGLGISVRVADDVPDMIVGDAARLRQILLNLLGNAVKFTTQGSVKLDIAQLHQTEKSIQLHFAIRDTGIGIAADKLDTIFEAFSQADNSMTRQYGGTGLGLAICSKLVHLMDGQIRVDSERGHGSTFSFTATFKKVVTIGT